MAVLHYGSAKIDITDDEVRSLTGDVGINLWEAGMHSLQLESGWIHFVTGPGCPIWIDQRTYGAPSVQAV
jgi:hypothetical protein